MQLAHWLIDYLRWRASRPVPDFGPGTTWHRDMVRWRYNRPRYRRNGTVPKPTLRDWGLAVDQDRQCDRRSRRKT